MKAMNLRRTRKGWEEIPPKHCANGHELRAGAVLVGTQHCQCGRSHRTQPDLRRYPDDAADRLRVPTEVPGRAVSPANAARWVPPAVFEHFPGPFDGPLPS